MHFNDGIQEFLTKESIESIFFLYLVILKIGGWGGGVGLVGVLLRGNQCREAVSGVFEINGIKFTPCSCAQGLSFPICNGGNGGKGRWPLREPQSMCSCHKVAQARSPQESISARPVCPAGRLGPPESSASKNEQSSNVMDSPRLF